MLKKNRATVKKKKLLLPSRVRRSFVTRLELKRRQLVWLDHTFLFLLSVSSAHDFRYRSICFWSPLCSNCTMCYLSFSLSFA
ncbi:hypothetical protein C8J56DRAFT_1171481 [Mycena floridula]|nr:hypothetical protein C8J56DRAFT_1171481 [Mycena floridula]